MGSRLIVEYVQICIGACAFAYFIFQPISTFWLALSLALFSNFF